jgi:Domain of Unknown Function (DUF1206)
MSTIRVARSPRRYSRNLHFIARAGYAARGIIYLIVGALAALAALGRGGGTTDSRGALSEVMSAPFGKFLLIFLALGLLGYAAWRLVQAVLDPDHHGTEAKGIAIRAALAVSAVIHASLAFFAGSLALDRSGSRQGGGSGDGSSQEWTAWLLSQPAGQWLVAGVGIAVAGAGVAHIVKGWRADFERHLEMNASERDFITPVSRFGLCARGVAFLLIGGFLLIAAIQHDPSEARGLSGTLQALQQQPFGWVFLAILALGLVAFGVYSLIESVYRKVDVPA